MSRLIDIVNFNADASCLNSTEWLSILRGGLSSRFCRWLALYVRHRKRMVLGITGATVSDLAAHNPEAITIVRTDPEIFQVILRPYSHDLSLLRTPNGFRFNVAAGYTVLREAFGSVVNYYLPPEFMLLSEQITALSTMGAKATFINPKLHTSEFALRIPKRPYMVQGIMGQKLGCIPVNGELTGAYLRAIQLWETEEWNGMMQAEDRTSRLWRDGESPFLLPDGIEREEFWLTNCVAEREHLGNEQYDTVIADDLYYSYPRPSFAAWIKEFRMLGFLGRIHDIEKDFRKLPNIGRYLWLLTINSDILSAVEKDSPTVRLRPSKFSNEVRDHRILRSERGHEGEEYLSLLEHCLSNGASALEFEHLTASYFIKAKGRIDHLQGLEPICSDATACL